MATETPAAAAPAEAEPAPAAAAAAAEEDPSAGGGRREKRWFPLESNPEVLTNYASALGAEGVQFVDVLATEDWALEMVPPGTKAVCFLFPIKEVTEAHKAEEAARIESEGQEVSNNVYYMKQLVGNACGTVAVLHALANAPGLEVREDSFLGRFLPRTRGQSAQAIGEALEADEEIEGCHGSTAEEGGSAQIPLDEAVNTHFVAVAEVDGHIYELDGRKTAPINHGPCTTEELLSKAVMQVVKGFMNRDPEELRFTILALVPSS